MTDAMSREKKPRCPCDQLPRAATAPAINPCLTGRQNAQLFTNEYLIRGGDVVSLRFTCRQTGITWLIDGLEDKGVAYWIYLIAPESWPMALKMLRQGVVRVQAIEAVASYAEQVGRLDLAEELLLEGLVERRWRVGHKAVAEQLLARLDRRHPDERQAAAMLRQLFEGDERVRVTAVRWLGLPPDSVRQHATRALIGALADPARDVAGTAARALSRSGINGVDPSGHEFGQILYEHYRDGRPCGCLVLPRREESPAEVSCLSGLKDPRGLTQNAPRHMSHRYPYRLTCRHSGITWLVSKWPTSPRWSYAVSPESWERVLVMAERKELVLADALLLGLQAQATGRFDLAERFLEQGVGPDGTIGDPGRRQVAESVLRDLRAAREANARVAGTIRALFGSDPTRRPDAVGALGATDGTFAPAVLALMGVLEDADDAVAQEAAQALERWGSQDRKDAEALHLALQAYAKRRRSE